MDPDFIELQAQGITQGATLKSAYILLFKEKDGNNLVPTLINKEEKDIIVSGLRTNFSFTSGLISSLCGAFNFQLQYLLFKVSPESLLTAHLFFLQEGLLHRRLGCCRRATQTYIYLQERFNVSRQYQPQRGRNKISSLFNESPTLTRSIRASRP